MEREWANVGMVGYDDYQIYLLLSCAPIQGHIAGLVDVSLSFFPLLSFCPPDICATRLISTNPARQIPNACTTLGLPMDIFDFDISPNGPVEKMDMGSCAK